MKASGTLIIVLLTLLVFPGRLSANKVVIKGSADSYNGQELNIYRFADFISLRKIKVGSCTIDKNGQFEFSFSSDIVDYITLSIDNKTTHLYCEPGKVYNLSFSAIATSNPFNNSIPMRFKFPEPTELNFLINRFIDDYAEFLIKNEKLIITKSGIAAVKKFEEITLKKNKPYLKGYLSDYLKYNLAALKDGVMANKKEIFENNFNSGKIRRNNYEYMNLFTQFYNKRFAEIALGKNGLQFLSAINGTSNYNKIHDIVKEDEYLGENDTLCELFILNGLQEAYYNEAVFERNKVITMLKYIQQNGLDKINKNIAGNIVFRLTHLSSGYPAPDFSFTGINNKRYSLNDFQGKPLYIQFWSSTSVVSIREMVLMNEFHKKYANQITFVSVNLDADKTDMVNQLKQKNYEWINCWAGNKSKMALDYEVGSLPFYVLIDQKGNIAQYPADRPSENIESRFFNLVRK